MTNPYKTHIGEHRLHPETQMLGYGYDPALSEGAVKPPVFLTSTFVFQSAEDGRDFFDYATGRKPVPDGTSAGLVYSRFNHPNSEIVEDRLALFERTESCVLFSSGMAAIANTLLAIARPGNVIVHSQPLYGGTEGLLANTLRDFDIHSIGFSDGLDPAAVASALAAGTAKGRVAAILVETPANPTNTLVDLAMLRCQAEDMAKNGQSRPLIICDNTLLGPLFQRPIEHGADISLYSLTKYVGGHSDLIAGAALGPAKLISPIRALRGAIGTQLDPHSCWMLGRSMETLTVRMEKAAANAAIAAEFLRDHPKVERVHYTPFADPTSTLGQLYVRQCTGAGSTFAFDIKGDRPAAYRFLNALSVMKLAVSLGGTESLASHPASMTHSGVPADVRARIGVLESTVRLSIGIEHADDLVEDIRRALESA